MTTLASFLTTGTWQELTGVSEIVAKFTIQNVGRSKCLIYLGETPVDIDATTIFTVGTQGKPSEWTINGFVNTEKVWVKSEDPTRISINKG